jgi:GntR family transcriptional regulator
MTFSDATDRPLFGELADPTVELSNIYGPIYVQLSTLFRKFIVRNQWPVGERIPNLEELAAQFGVNPATVSRAIGALERDGLVDCSRRRGTFVVAKPQTTHWYHVATDWAGAVQSYDGLTFKLLKDKEVKDVPTELCGYGSSARRYRHIRRLYRRGRVPVIVEDSYLDDRTYQKADRAGLRNAPAIKLVDRFVRSQRAVQTLRFGIADGEISRLLNVPLNAPLATVHLSVDDEQSVRCLESTAYIRGDTIRVVEPIIFAKKNKAGTP